MVCQALLALNSVALDQMTADGRLAQALTLLQDMTNSSILSIEQLEFILNTLPQPAEGQSAPPSLIPHPYQTDTWVVLREETLRAAYLVQTLNPISQVEAEKQMAAGLAEITDQSPLTTPNLIGAIPLPANARFWQWENGFRVFGLNEEEAIKAPAYSSPSARGGGSKSFEKKFIPEQPITSCNLRLTGIKKGTSEKRRYA